MSLDNLPVEWLETTFENIILETTTGLVRSAGEQADDKRYAYLKMNNLTVDGKFNLLDLQNVDATDIEVEKNQLLVNDFLFNTRNSPELVGKCGVWNKNIDSPILFNNNLLRVRFRYINPYIVSYWLNSAYGKKQLRELVSATTSVAAIYQKQLFQIKLPIPPLAEQQEIVRQLDVMLAQVEQIKARLDAIPAILKKFRQSVLADAVSGKLLDENADIWQENFLSDLTLKITDGEHLTPPTVDSGVPLLSAKDVHEQYIDFDHCKFIERSIADKALSRCDPQYHDLLVVSRGATVGRTHYLKNSQEFCLMGSVLLIRANMELINPAYLDIFFKSELGRKQLISSSGASAQQAIYIRDVKKMKISYPNMEIQEKIILKVSELLKFIDQIEKTIQSTQKRVNLLTQSILAKAFSGELTAEWREQHQELITGANSAESLLTKIQKEREASKPVKKAKKVK